MPTCRTYFFDSSAKCGRVCCCKPTAGDQSDRMGANQIRTKSTVGANLDKFRGDSDVRSCSGTLKGIVLSLDGSSVGSTHGANETQHRNRLDLDIAQSLNQALLVQAWILITRCTNFFLVQSNDENNHQDQSLFHNMWRVEQSAFHGIPRNSPSSMCVKKCVQRCHTEPSSIHDNSC